MARKTYFNFGRKTILNYKLNKEQNVGRPTQDVKIFPDEGKG